MKYYSEITNRTYNTEKECLEAEFKVHEEKNRQKILKEREEAEKKAAQDKMAAERKALAAEIEEARKVMVQAQKRYRELMEQFVKKYKTYHLSLSGEDVPSLFDIFTPFLF